MAVRGALFSFFLAISVIGLNADGELNILHSPESLKFAGHSRLLESSLKEVFSASLGLSVEENSDWAGLSITDPFNTPEAVVEVYIDGVPSLGNSAHLKSHQYPLSIDEYEPDTYVSLSHRINQRYSEGGNKLVNINLSDESEVNFYSDIFGNIKAPKVAKKTYQYLKPNSVEEDNQFLSELQTLNTVAEKVEGGSITPDNVIDVYNFRFRSLHALSDYHGAASPETKEAKKLLGEALERLNAAFVKAYDGSVLVAVVSSDVAHTRRAVRSAEEPAPDAPAAEEEAKSEAPGEAAPSSEGPVSTTQGAAPKKDLNLAVAYSPDYPVIFNILLWFGVIFTFALIAIVYAIMDMDPGRDSIIYRMTSNRMKKDN